MLKNDIAHGLLDSLEAHKGWLHSMQKREKFERGWSQRGGAS